jgi:EAL domain-containing protein (putative c-di-GMP-specific phosphodiesterase class I)
MTISRALEMARKTNGVCFYDEMVDSKSRESIQMELSLKDCVNNGMIGFDLHFHPIVELSSGTWKGLEALCRWESPSMGIISPERFIPDAERLGLIGQIGIWVLETGIRRSKELLLDEIDGYFISINVSPFQMMDTDFADNVIAMLKRYDYPGEKLNLEVTESAQMTFNQFTLGMIGKLRAHGITLSLDDFGTGYCSFNSLRSMPVSFLKTERDFIIGIEGDSYMQYFFYTMSEIAHANGMKLIAEGIETAEQLDVVKNNGADYIQGYFFSRPLPFNYLKEQTRRFHQIDPAFMSLKPKQMNISQWLNGQAAYTVTPSLFRVMSQCMELIINAREIGTAFNGMLSIIGKYFRVGRAFAYGRGLNSMDQQTYEWCSERCAPMHTRLDQEMIDKLDAVSLPIFKRDGMLVASDVKMLSEIYDLLLEGMDIQSIAILPMWDGEDLVGVIGFDDNRYREWSPEEIMVLWSICKIMASVIRSEHLKIKADFNRTLLTNMLNNTGMHAVISDPESYEILWASDVAIKHYGSDIFNAGKTCYETLAGQSRPCGHCGLPQLLANPKLHHITQEFYSGTIGKTFIVSHTIIPWETNGKKALVAYFLDVDEQREIMEKLASFPQGDVETTMQ